MHWRIEQGDSKDLKKLLNENDKFRAMVDDKPEKENVIKKGDIQLGSQRSGFHEYLLKGELNSRFLFRVVPIEEKDQWVVFRAEQTELTDDESDEGIWNLNKDRYKSVTYLDEAGKPLYINEKQRRSEQDG